jgi:hypothetical protein
MPFTPGEEAGDLGLAAARGEDGGRDPVGPAVEGSDIVARRLAAAHPGLERPGEIGERERVLGVEVGEGGRLVPAVGHPRHHRRDVRRQRDGGSGAVEKRGPGGAGEVLMIIHQRREAGGGVRRLAGGRRRGDGGRDARQDEMRIPSHRPSSFPLKKLQDPCPLSLRKGAPDRDRKNVRFRTRRSLLDAASGRPRRLT